MEYSASLLSDVEKNGIGILGLGVSAEAVIGYLKSRCPALGVEIPLFLRDKNPALSCPPSLGGLPSVFCRFGENWLEDIREKVLFRAPAVRPDLPPLVEATRKGALLTSEVALTARLCKGKIFAVTGSDGKTSTVSMLYEILKVCGKEKGFSAYLGGNIGTPLLCCAEEMGEQDSAMLELSSFQLFDLFPKSQVATVLNITPNHLDVHRSFLEYAETKTHILENAKRRVILPHCPFALDYLRKEDILCCAKLTPEQARQRFFGYAYIDFDGEWVSYRKGNSACRLFQRADLKVLGEHQLHNAMTAAAMAWETASPEHIRAGISGFLGVPHRLQAVAKLGDILCYDSSIDTTPARVEATLSAISGRPTVICGGSDKGLDYLPLAETLLRRAGRVVLTGDTAPKILLALETVFQREQKEIPVFLKKDFTDSVKTAVKETPKGEALVLSPGCASFDRFTNYKARGLAFLEILKELGATPIK